MVSDSTGWFDERRGVGVVGTMAAAVVGALSVADLGTLEARDVVVISVAWWLRDDTGEWTPWMDNTFTKGKA